MNGTLQLAGAVVGAGGLATLILGGGRALRFGGLAAWALGCGLLAAALAPAGHHKAYLAAAGVGAIATCGLAAVFLRVPWLLALSVVACAPARIPVTLGQTKANLLLPLYLVVAAAAAALVWQFRQGDVRSRELGRASLPLACFITWSGVAMLWSQGRTDGAKYLLFYLFPLSLIAIALARLPWREIWSRVLIVQLAAMGVVFGVIGVVQYLTRSIYWNPKVIVDNAYAPVSWFYRVNSVFYDPSIYGRFLAVALLACLVIVLFDPRPAVAWGAAATVIVIAVGLAPSFSQSSFVSVGVGIAVALVVLWRRWAVLPLAVVAATLLVVTLGVPQLRHRVVGNAGLAHATGNRSNLVSGGIRIALHHPLVGVGTGGFVNAYRHETHKRGRKDAASHDTAITMAAEGGVPGLALFVWLLASVLFVPFRGNRGATRTDRARLVFGLALVAITVHSFFYNALFEDPLFWGALALGAIASRPAPGAAA